MNKKYNKIIKIEVMKQKIFSLLLLMAATTLGAWAQTPTYKIVLSMQNGVNPKYEAVTNAAEIPNSGTGVAYDDAAILAVVQNAYNSQYPTASHTYTLNSVSYSGSSDASVSGTTIYIGPFDEGNSLTLNTAKAFTISFSVQPTAGDAINITDAILTVNVYHNTHNYSGIPGNWTYDVTNHWHACNNGFGMCDGSDDSKIDLQVHNWSSHVCTECNLNQPHSFDASWTKDGALGHYHKCSVDGCTLTIEDYRNNSEAGMSYSSHVYGTDPSLASYYTCQTPGCGYVDDSRITHTHNYATTWSHDDSQHWHACLNTLGTCNADKTDVDDHSYNDAAVGAAYYTCGVCGYENATRKSVAHTHDYYSWMKDETYHWKQCITPGPCQDVITEKAFHTYGTTGDARFTCTVCNFISSSRQAAAEAIDNGKAMAYSWTHDIPFAFAATNIFNDRQLNATGANNKQQGYTVCLPYELTLPATVEVYTLSASKDDQVGFVKTATNTLAPLTPYLIIPSVSGQLLNAPGATVVKTNQALVEANDVTSSAVSGQTTYTLKGSISYKSGDDAAADAANKYFIMQGENIWAKIEGGDYANTGANESKACVLPLRAYLVTAGAAPARLFSFFDETTGIRRDIVLDPDSTPVVYDLQGRRVNAPQRGGLYIINGKKMIMK